MKAVRWEIFFLASHVGVSRIIVQQTNIPKTNSRVEIFLLNGGKSSALEYNFQEYIEEE